jgi:hypothetical protein
MDYKIILYDLETMPDMDAAMEVFPQLSQYPGLTLKAEINSIICFGYKEYGVGKTAKCKSVWDMPGWSGDINDDKELCQFIHDTLSNESVDAVVTFNGKRFDEKFVQTRLAIHGLDFLTKVKHYDLYQVVKQNFTFFRNNLKTAAKRLTSEFKMSHDGWDMWVKVRKLVGTAMVTMVQYCKQDVLVMEPMFKRLRPLIKGLPNHNFIKPSGQKTCCRACGSTLLKVHGYTYSQTTRKKRLLCKSCKATFTPSKHELEGLEL